MKTFGLDGPVLRSGPSVSLVGCAFYFMALIQKWVDGNHTAFPRVCQRRIPTSARLFIARGGPFL